MGRNTRRLHATILQSLTAPYHCCPIPQAFAFSFFAIPIALSIQSSTVTFPFRPSIAALLTASSQTYHQSLSFCTAQCLPTAPGRAFAYGQIHLTTSYLVEEGSCPLVADVLDLFKPILSNHLDGEAIQLDDRPVWMMILLNAIGNEMVRRP